jgi:hypothetical protein
MSKNKLTPEERLKRYKEYLSKLAETEGRVLSSPQPVQEESKKSSEVQRPHDAYDRPREPPKHVQSPKKAKKQSLVSPSKRELQELKKAVALKAREKRKPSLSGRSITMLRVRSKAIARALIEIKNKRERLERRHDRGIIDQDEYQQELAKLVSEGHDLLREKTEIDEEIKILESKT